MDVRVGLWRRLSAKESMLLNCGVGEDSWVSLGLQGYPTSPFWRRSVLGFLWREWLRSWNSSTLATSCEELTLWKRLWCWEGLGTGGEGHDRGCDVWIASLTRWTWVWVNSGSWWWTGRSGVLLFMASQRVGLDWATELNWTEFHGCNRQMQWLLKWVTTFSLTPRMSTFHLAISCLTTSNLPWFMDLTFQVPMQYCSLQHLILPLSPVTSTTGYCFCFGSIPSFFLELYLYWSLVVYWAPTDLGSSSFSILSFYLFILFMGFSMQEYWSGLPFPSPVDHILSDLSTMTRLTWVAPHGMA